MSASDIEAVVDLLTSGLPGRSKDFWLRGFARLSSMTLPPNVPRYGVVLENDGRLVGVVIMIHSVVEGQVRCNLSGWYVEPQFRGFASVMVSSFLRPDILYFNVSPNPKTWRLIEAQGFRRYVTGEQISLHFLHPARRCRVRFARASDGPLLVDHDAFGCVCIVVEAGGASLPFVFVKEVRRVGSLRLPVAQLLYCPDLAVARQYAGPIGRFLLRRGILLATYDATEPNQNPLNIYSASSGPRYYLGAQAPRLGDLAYSEWAVFGPGLRGRGQSPLRSACRKLLGRMPRLGVDLGRLRRRTPVSDRREASLD